MKRSDRTDPVVAAARPPRSQRSSRWLLGGVILLAGFGAGGIFMGHRHEQVIQIQDGLPARPNLADRPAILRERVEQAEARALAAGTHPEGMLELARLYHANNFPSEAAACWQLVRSVQPSEARWCYYLAEARRDAGDYADLPALLEETLRLAPDYAPARLQLADLRFKLGDLTEAARHYRLRLAALPRDPYARLGLARVALQTGQTDEARRLLEELLHDTPTFSSGHNLYAEILAAAGDAAGASRQRWLGAETLRYRAAADPWREELLAWCYDYDRLCMLGTAELQTENDDQARAFFDRAIRLEPGEPAAYELLASLHLKRQDAAGARDLLEEALPRLARKDSPVFFTALSQAYRELHEPAQAVRVARLGLAEAGASAEMLDALGQALAAGGQHAEALAAWQSALAQKPRDAGINYHRALSLLALHRLDEALEALDHSLTLQPTYLPTLLLRGQIELEAGHLDQAENYLRPAFTAHPEDAQARRFLAEWHLRTGAKAEANGDAARAERHYQDGLILDENHAGLLLRLGAFYLVRQRTAEAITPLSRHHRLLPENAPGCLFLGQAYAISGERDKAREILTAGMQLADRSGDQRTATHCRQILTQL